MKISVIGYAGSGKSSFATKLGIHYNIETTYLDK
jgi:adenylate kinase family enzyme